MLTLISLVNWLIRFSDEMKAGLDCGVRDGVMASDWIMEPWPRGQCGAPDGVHCQVLLVGNWLLHNAGHNAGSRWLLHLLGMSGLGTSFLHLFVLLRRGSATDHERRHCADHYNLRY